LKAEAAELSVELATHYEDVELQAVPPAVWETLVSSHTTDSGDLDPAALPAMLAACCVDPELQDTAWWAGQLDGEQWTFGERNTLFSAVLTVNAYQPRPGLGKD
jgi:hypothetical protein